ncbi:hypothetical protein [Rubellicoccus peritrichatus]|uniref:Uncharacterized protein n=1 Tax=Rubellicoccus peritrichatus TaxID=3080537 RepID=A0AAQ3L8J5_9BACT|nr:hypothetical protein [Puniceicoccus sp. CR14]WOO39652.1 hypothetical protein RZN69_13595 [Puniceicoccus sp. CR14]
MTIDNPEALADLIAQKVAGMKSPIIDTAEGMLISKCKSEWAWKQFKQRNHLKPLQGRTDAYSREEVHRACRKEATRRRKRKPASRPSSQTIIPEGKAE